MTSSPVSSRLFPVYEDTHLLVVYKPPQLHSVANPNSNTPSFASVITSQFPECAEASEKSGEGGLVHRLDFDTCGLLIVARDRSTWCALRAAIQGGRITKSYLTVVDGIVERGQLVENYLGTPYRRSKRVRVYEQLPRGKVRALEARSQIIPIASNESLNVSLVQVKASTARRHQVRAHCARIGHPLVGDLTYGSERTLGELSDLSEEISGAFLLIAHTLDFKHPVSGAAISVRSKLPRALNALFSLPKDLG